MKERKRALPGSMMDAYGRQTEDGNVQLGFLYNDMNYIFLPQKSETDFDFQKEYDFGTWDRFKIYTSLAMLMSNDIERLRSAATRGKIEYEVWKYNTEKLVHERAKVLQKIYKKCLTNGVEK